MWFIHELHHFLNLNCIFFPAHEATLITKQPIRFQGLFKVTNQIAEKWKTKGTKADFATFVSKTLTFSHRKTDEFNFTPTQYCIIYLNWPSPVLEQFQNGCILVWNHTCDFKWNLHCTLVQFWNHAYDFSPNCTSLSSITIIKCQSSSPAWQRYRGGGPYSRENYNVRSLIYPFTCRSDQKWDSPDVIDKIASKEVGRRQKYQLEYYIWLNTTFSELKL